MPKARFEKESINSSLDISSLAGKYSVSDSAVVMRAYRLGKINDYEKMTYLNAIHASWEALTSNKGGGRQLALEKAINRYNNPAIVRLVLDKYRSNDISERDMKNLLCYKKGDSLNIGALEANV